MKYLYSFDSGGNLKPACDQCEYTGSYVALRQHKKSIMKGSDILVISVIMQLLHQATLKFTKNQNMKGSDIPVISVIMLLVGYQI